MGKVKQNEIRRNEKSTSKKSTAMARREDGGERDLRARAIQMAVQRGFQAHADNENVQRVEESGLVEKEMLVGIPFLILDVQVREGDFADSKRGGKSQYISVTCMLETNEVIVFNDGSTGVMAQLEGLDVSPDNPLLVPAGLRKSEYTNEYGPATTYYLSGSRDGSKIRGLQKNRDANGVGRRSEARA